MASLPDAFDSIIEKTHAKKNGTGWKGHCPGPMHKHGDRDPSLSISRGDGGRTLLYCHAGCGFSDVMTALDMATGAAFPDTRSNGRDKVISATYDYRDAAGAMLYQVVRFEPKGFSQRRPDGNGGWTWTLGNVQRVPYRLRELHAANPDEWVFITEGEKDADRLAALGVVATTNAGGAGKWRPEYGEYFRGRRVAILPDNDEPGAKHAAQVIHALTGIAADVRTVALPDLPAKGDVSDWLDAGGTADALRAMAEKGDGETAKGDGENGKSDQSYTWEPPSQTEKNVLSSKKPLTFRGADEITDQVGNAPPMLAPYLFRQSITEIDGAIKQAGKTTFVTHLCHAIIDGADFLGAPTQQSPIVYLSEQTPATFAVALQRAGLVGRPEFRYVLYGEAMDMPWPAVVKLAREEAARIGAQVLVVDTLTQWAGLRGDAENSAGAALTAMAPLQAAAAQDGLGVLALRHDRKSGGDVGTSARGSSAFGGAVDVIARIRRPDGAEHPTLRVIDALSRFDGVPDMLRVELTDTGYAVAVGGDDEVSPTDALYALTTYIPSHANYARTEQEIIKASGMRRSTVRDAIKKYLDLGFLYEIGGGKKGDPLRYWFPRARNDANSVSDGGSHVQETPKSAFSPSQMGFSPSQMDDGWDDGPDGQ